jgi:hypothetical protein
MSIPVRLYKYRTFNEYLFSTLEKGEVYFAEPSEFNDPFDTDSSIELGPEFYLNPLQYLEPVFKNIQEDDPVLAQDFREGVKQEFGKGNIQGIKDTVLRYLRGNDGTKNEHAIGIFCLSKSFANMAQWAYYALNHSGLCLEFNATKAPFNMKDEVVYKDEIILFKPEDMFNHEKLVASLLRKAPCWQHEEEVRCFWLDGPGPQKFEREDLTKVIFGCKAKKSDKDKVKSILESKGYQAELFTAFPKLESYGMELRQE